MIYEIKKIKCFSIYSFLFILTLSLVSCTKINSSNDVFIVNDTDTIRYETNNRIENSAWTDEIHKSRLVEKNSKSKTKSDIFFSSVKLSKNNAIQTENGIYPEIVDFYPLDLSNINSNTKVEITKLINKIKKENITKTDFLLKSAYEKILFDYEFSKHSEIKDYYLCSPLEITENEIVIPVQFLFSDGRLNTVLYLQKEDNELKIEKIEFGEFSSDK